MRLDMVTSEAATEKLSGGELCLDFANTLNGHGSATPHEYLRGYPDLVVWSCRAGLVTNAEAERLLRRASQDSRTAGVAYSRALELRETIFRVFSALALSRSPRTVDVAVLNEARLEALNRSTIRPRDGGYAVDWPDKSPLAVMRSPIVLSAAELLTSPHLTRVRECAGEGCDWLFVCAT